MEKRKFDVTIAGVDLSIISDEREEYVSRLCEKIDSELKDILIKSKRSSKMDAALLLALDYCSEKTKSEKRVRNLEAQIALYDANLRRMREENIKLRSALLSGRDKAKAEAILAEAAKVDEEEKFPEETEEKSEEAERTAINTDASFDETTETAASIAAAVSDAVDSDSLSHTEEPDESSLSRGDKLRQIADLLGRKD